MIRLNLFMIWFLHFLSLLSVICRYYRQNSSSRIIVVLAYTVSTLIICVYSTIFIISHIGVWWHLIIADMEYCLNYIFKGKHYTTKYILPLKASTNQLEAIAQGLALTSAEQNNHKSYGRYTDMNLFEDGILVWHSDVQIILENYSCNL